MSGAHSQTKQSRPKQASAADRGWVVAITLVAVAVVAVGATAVVVREGTRPGLHASTDLDQSAAAEIGVTTHPARSGSFRDTPADGTTQVPSDATISVQFSEPLAAHSPTPSLSPAVAGTWQVVTPDTLHSWRRRPWFRRPTETVTVPGGSSGMTSLDGRELAAGHHLPVHRGPGQHTPAPATAGPTRVPAGELHSGRTVAAPQEATQPQQGSFDWRWNEPAALESSGHGDIQRHHHRGSHGVRVAAQPQNRRGGRARGVAQLLARPQRGRWTRAVQLRLRHQRPARDGHRLQQRRGGVLDPGQHRCRRGGHGVGHLPGL